jgi:hypothetical protein
MTPAGFPHSDIPGSTRICRYPRLFAAYHVLHRLLVPRHPPCALSNLTGHPSVLAFATYPFSPIRLSKTRLDHFDRDAGELQRIRRRSLVETIAGPAGACARGTVIELALFFWLVEIAGIEPATSGLQSRRSAS